MSEKHKHNQQETPSATEGDAPVLTVKGLNFYYGKHKALHDINLDFYKGKVTALMGPSGSGKSTLIRIFNRIFELYPSQRAEGEIVLNGENVLDRHVNVNDLRLRVGMVFQKPTPFPMSIFDNVAFPLRRHFKFSHADLHERVEWALQKSALWEEVKDRLKEPGTGLSGGQQQRLCIARSIAVKPEVILFDEPTSALDPMSTAKVEDTIVELNKEFTVILVSHNLNQTRRTAAKTVFMVDGKLVEVAETEEFFNNPKDERTKTFINSF